ncbi:hypothetical protein HK102_001121 [Quaeritorhiza haematococci]|nr:hypothetical protein HK102_001121 [Quaeritorhiza haematococci]
MTGTPSFLISLCICICLATLALSQPTTADRKTFVPRDGLLTSISSPPGIKNGAAAIWNGWFVLLGGETNNNKTTDLYMWSAADLISGDSSTSKSQQSSTGWYRGQDPPKGMNSGSGFCCHTMISTKDGIWVVDLSNPTAPVQFLDMVSGGTWKSPPTPPAGASDPSPSASSPRDGVVAAMGPDGRTIYIFGGQASGPGANTSVYYDDFYAFDTISGSWKKLQSLGVARFGSMGGIVSDSLLLLGGAGSTTTPNEPFTTFNDFYSFSLAAGSWRNITGSIANFPQQHYGASGVVEQFSLQQADGSWSWSDRTPQGFPNLCSNSLALDEASGVVLSFGDGQGSTRFFGLDLNTGKFIPDPTDFAKLLANGASTGNRGKGISSGAIAGIVIATIVVLGAIALFVWYRQHANKKSDSTADTSSAGINNVSNTPLTENASSPSYSTNTDLRMSISPTPPTPMQYIPAPSPTSAPVSPFALAATSPEQFPLHNASTTFTVVNQKAQAVTDYIPRMPDELVMMNGDVVMIRKIHTDGWAMGYNERSGQEGMFPMTLVEVVEIYPV